MRTLKISGTVLTITPIAFLSLAFVLSPDVAMAVPPDDAAQVFKARCAPCHGNEGSADTPAPKNLNLKDLRSPEVQKKSDAELAQIIGKGSSNMPGFEKSLGAEKVKAQVAYIRGLAKKK